MNKLKGLLSFFIAVMLIIGSSVSCFAATYNYDGDLKSESVLLVNMDTDTPVVEKNNDVKMYPAELTMIMTYIIVSENVEDFSSTKVEIKSDIIHSLDGTNCRMSGIESKIGEKMTVLDLLNCMMIGSGNDAAAVLADYVGGGQTQTFVDMMNTKAQELGCTNTNYVYPHGVHNDNHYTTADDLYKITSYALTLPMFSEITNTATYYCEGDSYPLVTTNEMIDLNRGGTNYYTYAKGIMYGVNEQAGRCLVTTAIAEGYAYMCICMKADDYNGLMTEAKELMRWALLNLDLTRMLTTDTPVCEVKVNFTASDTTTLVYPAQTVNTILPEDYNPEDVTVEPSVPESIDAPVTKGDLVGTATVYYQGQMIQTVDLVAGEDIAKSDLSYTMHTFKSVLTSIWFWIAVVLAGVLVIVYIFLATNVHRSKKNRRVKKYRRL